MNSRFTLVLCRIEESEHSALHNFRSVLLWSVALHIHVVVTPYTLSSCRVYRGKDLCVIFAGQNYEVTIKKIGCN